MAQDEAQVAVLIGRFQPYHLGHAALVERALEVAPRVLVIVGSAHGPRLAKNPFTAAERVAVIGQSLAPSVRARVTFASVRDYFDEPRWAMAVRKAVQREAPRGGVTLVGFRKDDTTSYLNAFPEWSEHSVPRQAPIDATSLRHSYFTDGPELAPELVASVPPPVASFLRAFRQTAEFARLREELEVLEQGRATFGTGPFVTVDAVVTAASHVLLVQRGRAPGKGLWALPGGFLDGSERLLGGAIRELYEETRLPLPEAELRAALRDVAVFDHPQRSQRGRTITHAHYFALPDTTLAPVAGADDAQAARWVPLSELASMTDRLFDDHYQIIDHFLRLPPLPLALQA